MSSDRERNMYMFRRWYWDGLVSLADIQRLTGNSRRWAKRFVRGYRRRFQLRKELR